MSSHKCLCVANSLFFKMQCMSFCVLFIYLCTKQHHKLPSWLNNHFGKNKFKDGDGGGLGMGGGGDKLSVLLF